MPLAFAAFGCAHATRVSGPDDTSADGVPGATSSGAEWWSIECSNQPECLNLAAEKCPHGYAIADKDKDVLLYWAQNHGAMGTTVIPFRRATYLVRCREREVQPSETWSGSVSAPEGDPPGGAAGFVLGALRSEVEQACTDAGHDWSVEDGLPSCSGTAEDIGLPAKARFDFCDDELCVLELRVFPEPDANPETSSWLDTIGKLKRALRERYGKPTLDRPTVPRECNRDMDACLESGEAKMSYLWRWPNGFDIRLYSEPDATVPYIGVKYVVPQEKLDEEVKGL